ncbi:hypothetical protein ABT330_36595 [Streptomyces sp. NPDC000658]|uniref:hypothetical protein n=1 Tax=Streptomyces sp. NPDC000658 TaxID=3154266 RepID=UPI0033233E56
MLTASPAFLSAEDLLEQVWDEHADPFINTVTVTACRLPPAACAANSATPRSSPPQPACGNGSPPRPSHPTERPTGAGGPRAEAELSAPGSGHPCCRLRRPTDRA